MVGADRRLFWVYVSLLVHGDVSCCWLRVGVTSARALLSAAGYGGADPLASWGCDLGVRVAEPGVAARVFQVALLKKQSGSHAKSQTAPLSPIFLGNYWIQKY